MYERKQMCHKYELMNHVPLDFFPIFVRMQQTEISLMKYNINVSVDKI